MREVDVEETSKGRFRCGPYMAECPTSLAKDLKSPWRFTLTDASDLRGKTRSGVAPTFVPSSIPTLSRGRSNCILSLGRYVMHLRITTCYSPVHIADPIRSWFLEFVKLRVELH